MLRNFVIALCLVVHTSHSCYENVLVSTHSEVLAYETKNVTITCRYDCPHNRDELSIIRIYKKQNNSDVIFGEAVRNKNGTYEPYVRQNVASRITYFSSVDLAYLSLTWSKASQYTPGNYWCLIGVKEENIRTNSLTIKDLAANLFRIANNNLKRMEKKAEELESKISATANQLKMFKLGRFNRSYYETRVWPRGKYALFNTRNGCPKSSTDAWQPGYFAVIAEHEKEDIEKQTDFHYPDLFRPRQYRNNPRINSATAVEALFSTCRRGSIAGPGWPRGRYCIYRIGRKCPQKFKRGAVALSHGNEAYLKNAKSLTPVMSYRAPDIDYKGYHTVINFCCRSDGDPEVPIRLPVSTPFYLYRNKGRCQRVHNAKVTEEQVSLKTAFRRYLTSVKPDTSFKVYANFKLCYYEPLE